MRIVLVLIALAMLAGCGAKKKKYFKNTQDGHAWYSTSRGNEQGHFRTLDFRMIDLDGAYRSEEVWWDEIPESVRETAVPKYRPPEESPR